MTAGLASISCCSSPISISTSSTCCPAWARASGESSCRRALHGFLKLAGGAVLGGLLAYAGTPTETAVYIMLVVVAVTVLVCIVAEGSGALIGSELALSTAVLLCSGLVIGLFVAG